MPDLVRFLVHHALVGSVFAVATVAAMLWVDVAGLRTLLWTSRDGPLALALLVFFMALTFGSVQMGFAVMRDRRRPHDPPHR